MLHQAKIGRRITFQPSRDKRRADIKDHRRWRPGIGALWIESGSIGEWLERGTGLAWSQRSVNGPVDALIEIVRATEHRQYVPRVRIKRDKGGIMRIVRGLPRWRVVEPL